MKSSLALAVFGAFFVSILFAQAGESTSNGGRGGLPDRVDEAAFVQYITEGGLKMSMLHYLDTLQLSQVSSKPAKAAFQRMLTDGALQKDIESSDNYLIGLERCQESNTQQDALAWTHTGKDGVANTGGAVCFDVQRLVRQFKASGLGVEDAVIKIAALTFHEHVHHFQNEAGLQSVVEQQENEANAVGGYVELTAKLAQVPLLKWATPGENSGSHTDVTPDYFQQIESLYQRGHTPEPLDVIGWYSGRCYWSHADHNVPGNDLLIGMMDTNDNGPLFPNQTLKIISTNFGLGSPASYYDLLTPEKTRVVDDLIKKAMPQTQVAFLRDSAIVDGEISIRKYQNFLVKMETYPEYGTAWGNVVSYCYYFKRVK